MLVISPARELVSSARFEKLIADLIKRLIIDLFAGFFYALHLYCTVYDTCGECNDKRIEISSKTAAILACIKGFLFFSIYA